MRVNSNRSALRRSFSRHWGRGLRLTAAVIAIIGFQALAAGAASAARPILGPVFIGEVTSNSAQLEGLVNPNGLQTTYFFEYATNSGFSDPRITTPTQIGAAESEEPVQATVFNLELNRIYYFRLKAFNDSGISVGTFEEGSAGSFETESSACESAECQLQPAVSDTTLATLEPGRGNPPVTYKAYCRKGFVKKRGACVKKRANRHRPRHHRHRRRGSGATGR